MQDSYAAGPMHCCPPSGIRKPVLLGTSMACLSPCLRHNTPAVSCTVPCQAFAVLSVPNSCKMLSQSSPVWPQRRRSAIARGHLPLLRSAQNISTPPMP
jgi:hypothetical protein